MAPALTESREGSIVQARGTFADAKAADDALAAYLTKWHPFSHGTAGRVVPTVQGFVVLCSRSAGR